MSIPASRPPVWRRRIWIAYWIAIFVATHLPPSSRAVQLAFRLPDWVLHGLAYAGLGALATAAMSGRPKAGRLAIVFAVLLAYGGFDELTQPFVRRSCELSDWIADAIGGLAGIAAVTAFRYRRGDNDSCVGA